MFVIAEILVSYADEATGEMLEIIVGLINFGNHLFFDFGEVCYNLIDSILRLMIYLTYFFPSTTQGQRIQHSLTENQLPLKKWSLFC